jgi:protein translocase SecG subunit
METALLVFQIILAISIVTVILLQAQGSGLGSTWGGGGETFHTKRGVEKVLLYITVALITLFCLTSLAVLLV